MRPVAVMATWAAETYLENGVCLVKRDELGGSAETVIYSPLSCSACADNAEPFEDDLQARKGSGLNIQAMDVLLGSHEFGGLSLEGALSFMERAIDPAPFVRAPRRLIRAMRAGRSARVSHVRAPAGHTDRARCP